MATIPLPALDVRPPAAQPSPLEMYGQMMGIKNAQQEQQQRAAMAPLQQQQAQQAVQAGQLENQQRQQQLRDAQTLRSLSPNFVTKDENGKVTGYDFNGLFNQAAASGVSPQTLSAFQKSISDATLARANATKGDLENQQTLNNEAFNHLEGLRGAQDPAQRQQLWQSAVDWSMKNATALGIDPGKFPTQAPDDNGLSALEASLGMHAQQIADAGKVLSNKKLQGGMDPQSIFYAPSAEAVAMGTAPGAAQIQQGEAREAGAKAAAEAAARQPYEKALAAQRQALSQGDPNAAGKLLVDGDATLAELKSRGATPDFIARALFAAHQLSGGTYNAQQADAQFDVAKSPTNVAFFGSAKSLTDKGGTLDQLEAAGKAIPGGQLPAFNSLADWEKAATGSGPIAKYASLALGVADDYSKVMGGGQGSDTSRLQALKLIGADQSPEQRAAAVEGVRGAVSSQMNSRIGQNPVLQRMYGGSAAAQPQRGSAWPPSANAQRIAVGSVISQNGHRYRVTAVDKNGRPVAAEAAQ